MEFEAQSEPNLRKEEGEDEGEDGKMPRPQEIQFRRKQKGNLRCKHAPKTLRTRLLTAQNAQRRRKTMLKVGVAVDQTVVGQKQGQHMRKG